MMYETIEFDLDIEIHPRDAANLSYDPDPLSHPRFDLFQRFPHGWPRPTDRGDPARRDTLRRCARLLHRTPNVTASPSSTWVFLDDGDRQISLRLYKYRDQAYWETGTHSWCSSEPAFEEVTEIIKASVAAGESPLWNLVRGMSLPAEFIDALSMGIGCKASSWEQECQP